MSRYGQRSRLTGGTGANTINYWFGGGFAITPFNVDYLVVAGGGAGAPGEGQNFGPGRPLQLSA
jgi:hypothetical protein